MSKVFSHADKLSLPGYANLATALAEVESSVSGLESSVAGLGTASSKSFASADWTPAWAFSGGGTWTTGAALTANGRVWKLDTLVIVEFEITTDATSDSPTGEVRIANLPYPIRTTSGTYTVGRYAPSAVYSKDWAANAPTILVPQPLSSQARLMRLDTTGHVPVMVADMAAGNGKNYINGSLIYFSGT